MKYKSIAVATVLAMFLASSMCILCSDSQGSGTADAVNVNQIAIDDSTPYTEYWSDGGTNHAVYTPSTKTLTISNINAVCNDSPVIKSTANKLTIVIEGSVTLSGTSLRDEDSICISAVGSGSTNYGLILWGNENSSLKLIPIVTSTTGKVSFGINADYLYMENCNLTIDCGNTTYSHFIGIQSFGLNIINSDVTINGKYREGMCWDVGIRNDYATNIKKSKLIINDVTRGITASGSLYLGGEMGGTCIVNDSEIRITCANGVVGAAGSCTGSSIGLNLTTLIAKDSNIYAAGGTCHYSNTDMQGASVGINVHTMSANGCHIECSGKLWAGQQYAYVSSGLEFWMNVELSNCTLKCYNEGGTRNELQTAIKSLKGVLMAENSTIVAENTCTTSNRNCGIGCNSEFTNCMVDAKGIDGAFYSNRIITFKDVSKLQGFDEKSQKWVDISNEDVYNYKEIRSFYQSSADYTTGIIGVVAVILVSIAIIGPVLFMREK